MNYVITNGKNYLTISSENGVVATNKIGNAKVFTHSKAQNVLLNLPRSMKNIGYYIQPIEESNEKDNNLQSGISLIEYKNDKTIVYTDSEIELVDELGDFKELKNKVEDFYNLIEQACSLQTELKDKLVTLEKKQQDIIHAAEFCSFNACQGFKIYRNLKEVRQERRKVKNSITVIKILQDSFGAVLNHVKPHSRMEGLQEQVYEARTSGEFFTKSS